MYRVGLVESPNYRCVGVGVLQEEAVLGGSGRGRGRGSNVTAWQKDDDVDDDEDEQAMRQASRGRLFC